MTKILPNYFGPRSAHGSSFCWKNISFGSSFILGRVLSRCPTLIVQGLLGRKPKVNPCRPASKAQNGQYRTNRTI
ncbi:hypothetical protein YC2023_095740 [Brassica napus]